MTQGEVALHWTSSLTTGQISSVSAMSRIAKCHMG